MGEGGGQPVYTAHFVHLTGLTSTASFFSFNQIPREEQKTQIERKAETVSLPLSQLMTKVNCTNEHSHTIPK